MTTLIAVYTSDGCVGRCDARCYGAKHPDCNCICGGKNHGAGLQQAMDNTREMVEGWIEDYAEKNDVKLDLAEVLGKLSPADNPSVPVEGERISNRRYLSTKQRQTLEAALNGKSGDLSVGKRTKNSLIRRDLLTEDFQVTETGLALLKVMPDSNKE
jgi:predicted RNase H-like HicB family nuclease